MIRAKLPPPLSAPIVTGTPSSEKANSPRRIRIAFVAALIAGGTCLAIKETARLRILRGERLGVAGWLSYMDVDSTPFAVLFLLLPLFWWPRRELMRLPAAFRACWRRWFQSTGGDSSTWPGDRRTDVAARSTVRVLVLALIVAAASIAASLFVATRPVTIGRRTFALDELPPVYHDEYSYLFQAETYLAGRWSFPSHPLQPRLFDTMHVVNDGRFASRYFPGPGAWMAPFVALGHPYWGHWLAGALAAMCIFAAGRELAGNGVGFLAGMLTAVSPGLAVFSNLLLAHHPTLLGLSLFVWLFLRMMRTGQWWCALFAGAGLAFAMLCRPMTAFGCSLPFAIVFGWLLFRRNGEWPVKRRLQLLAAITAPLLLGFVIVLIQNRAITGDWLSTPYGKFQTKYTPHHLYGFHNVQRAEAQIARGEALTDDVFENYSRWAKDLTPELAAENAVVRLRATAAWTLGIVPLLMAGVVFLLSRHAEDRRWWLIAAAFASIHLAHLPYWFTGIMDWHYVFESAPLALLLFARATQVLCRHWRRARRPLMPLWWGLLALVALATAYVSPELFWEHSRIDAAAAEFAFTKKRYLAFDEFLDRRVTQRPALVLVEPDPAERHFEFIHNPPDLSGPLLIGRYRPGKTKLSAVTEAFPDRAVYLWRMREGTFERVGGRLR